MENFNSDRIIEKYLDSRLLQEYLAEVIRANNKFNLFSRKLTQIDLRLLVAESLIPVELDWLNDRAFSLLDIGSGWGIPAIPLAMACPRIAITLLERSRKKADFLQLLRQRLKIKANILNLELGQLDDSSKYPIFTMRRVAINIKLVENIGKIATADARLIYFGSQAPQNLFNSIQSIEYKIDHLETRHISKIIF